MTVIRLRDEDQETVSVVRALKGPSVTDVLEATEIILDVTSALVSMLVVSLLTVMVLVFVRKMFSAQGVASVR